MLGLLSLLAVAMNPLAVALFVVGYRAPTLEQLRTVERWALYCVAVTFLAIAWVVASVLVQAHALAQAARAGGAMGTVTSVSEVFFELVLLVIPLTAWLGVVALRRRRAEHHSR